MSLSRYVKGIVHSDEMDNPYAYGGDATTGTSLLPAWNMPPIRRKPKSGSNPYAAADAGGFGSISRGVKPAVQPTSFNDAIQNISEQYPSQLTQDDINQVLSRDFGSAWEALFDPVTGNTAQSVFQAAGGGEDGLLAALGLTKEDSPSGSSDDFSGGGGGGGGGIDPVAYAKAINDYIALVDAGRTDFDTLQSDLTGRFAGYGENLSGIADAAVARQEASAARAAEALAAIDPQTAFQFNVDPASMGSGAALGYLESIGASTAAVEGLRDFEQSLLNQQLAGARQFSEGQQSALDNERAARQAAVVQMAQEAKNALDAQRMAYEMGLSDAERRALEALLGRQTAEKQSVADRILEAKLMAAKAGVAL